MARKDKNYVFKDSNEDQRKVKVSKRVNWMKKKAIEEQKQAQSNQEQIVKNDFALDQKEILEVHQELKNEDVKIDNQKVVDDSIVKLETSNDQGEVRVKETNILNDLNKNPIQLDFEEKEKAYLAALKETEKAALKLRIEKERGSVIRKIDRWSKRGGRLRREIFVKRQYYYLVAPYTILFFIFTVVPVLMSLVLSFTYFNLLEFPTFVGWDNYKSLFVDDKVFMIALKNTAILAVITGPVSYIMAFVFAWLINELKPLLRSFMTLIFYAPSISGNVYLVWKLIFSSDNYGYANSMLMELNIIQEPITWLQDPDYIIWILIIVQLWMSLGVSFLSFIAGLQGVNKEYYEAGAIDGIKSRWQELWYITLPQMKSQLMFGAVMQITSSLAIAEVSINIAGFPSIEYAGHTIITHLMDYGNTRMEMGYASAIATILFLIMILANLLVRKILRRVGS
jgi:ABC transporter, permease protein